MVQTHHSLTHRSVGLTFTFAAVLLLSGCPAPATRPSEIGQPAPGAPESPQQPIYTPPPPTPPAPRPAPPPRENHLTPATRSLVQLAKNQLARGDTDGASATLDRALRIEPHNPLLWIERGRLRLAEHDPHQAEGCGRKALALASGDPRTQKQAGLLLVDALRAQGRNPEAHAVENQPFMH